MSELQKSKLTLELDKVKFSSKSLQVTEQSAKGVAYKMYENILEGNTSAMQTAEFLAFISKVADEIKGMQDINGKNKYTDLVREEIQLHADNKKSYTTSKGSKIELFTSSGKGDYSVCNHPYYDYLCEQEAEIKKKKKDIETYLKTIKIPTNIGNVSNPDTGELYENVEVNPPSLPKTDTFKITLLKD